MMSRKHPAAMARPSRPALMSCAIEGMGAGVAGAESAAVDTTSLMTVSPENYRPSMLCLPRFAARLDRPGEDRGNLLARADHAVALLDDEHRIVARHREKAARELQPGAPGHEAAVLPAGDGPVVFEPVTPAAHVVGELHLDARPGGV